MPRPKRIHTFETNPQHFAENAIGVGFSIACGLFARGREDVMRMIDRNTAFQSACAKMIAQSWLSDATKNQSNAELSASFAALIDGLIAKADAAKQGAPS